MTTPVIPLIPTLMLPPGTIISTADPPFIILAAVTLVNNDPLPTKKLAVMRFTPVMLPFDPVVLMLPPAMLPVVVTLPVSAARLPVYVGRYAATLALPYVAGSPVNCEPLPRM